jgi:hypothetical protein
MKPKRLTKAERDWLARLQDVLNECPSDRIGAYTIGDANLFLYDRRFEEAIHERTESVSMDFCQAVDAERADLCDIRMPFPVHATSG